MSGPATALIGRGRVEPCRPWPRVILDPALWTGMARALAEEPSLALLGVWADTLSVHALFIDDRDRRVQLVSTEVREGFYAALSPARPGALWFERAVHDLWGHRAEGGRDPGPWLDHGRWSATYPMSHAPGTVSAAPEPPEFLPIEDEAVHHLPLGPVRAGLGEPSHLRITALGETIVRAEARLGYAHKGVLMLMRGKSPRAATRYAARLAADSTVAHSIAFARAAEAALGTEAPPRADALRAVMAEHERIAAHLGELGRVCRVAGFAVAAERFGLLRERLVRAAATGFGHRLMMDCVVPGGVAADIVPGGPEAILHALAPLGGELAALRRDLEGPAGFAARARGIGTLDPAQAKRFAAGGFIGRASRRRTDARRMPGYPPYEPEGLLVPVLARGDVAARIAVRLAETAESIRLLRAMVTALPEGGWSVPLPNGSGEGIGVAEGVRGDIWHWLRLDNGLIVAAFARDPAWAHWPLLEAALEGADTSDVPLISASFNATVSGIDL
ncbi:MAG: hydrogenase expression protein HypE [Acetobacteraceae bacterium]|nr:hydrogenase expression protein HypE [Acetobacteraceae bacterium]